MVEQPFVLYLARQVESLAQAMLLLQAPELLISPAYDDWGGSALSIWS